MSTVNSVPLFEVWHLLGPSSRFVCGGRCFTGPRQDQAYTLCAWGWIAAPSLFYFLVCAPQLWHSGDLAFLAVATLCLLVCTAVLFLLTACTDPGVVPRRTVQDAVPGLAEQILDQIGFYDLDKIATDTASSSPHSGKTPASAVLLPDQVAAGDTTGGNAVVQRYEPRSGQRIVMTGSSSSSSSASHNHKTQHPLSPESPNGASTSTRASTPEHLSQQSPIRAGGPSISAVPVASRPLELTLNQMRAGYRICRTCEIIRPPRSGHCADCGQCVIRFDHHCPFLGTCIGQRNYTLFWFFLASLAALGSCVVLGIFAWLQDSFGQDRHHHFSPGTLIVLMLVVGIPTALLVLVVIGFCLCHLFLVFRGLTTREFLRPERVVPPEDNLSSGGSSSSRFSNPLSLLFSTRMPALVPPEAPVDLLCVPAGTGDAMLEAADRFGRLCCPQARNDNRPLSSIRASLLRGPEQPAPAQSHSGRKAVDVEEAGRGKGQDAITYNVVDHLVAPGAQRAAREMREQV
ncbi:unnamed protein product [Amoebophrya sp. A25]|nr:unnamed protein product [Amoebophrya sp. A25]|eukprot:GSA25T00020839001.1